MFHPDKFDPVRESAEHTKATGMTRELLAAYSVLSDPVARRNYDLERMNQGVAPPRAPVPTPAPSPEPQAARPQPPPGKTWLQRLRGHDTEAYSMSWFADKAAKGFAYLMVGFAVFVVWLVIGEVWNRITKPAGPPAPKVLTREEAEQIESERVLREAKAVVAAYEKAAKTESIQPGPEVPFPAHGAVNFITGEERIARLKIETPDDGTLYYISLKDAQSGRKVASIYLKGGKSFQTKVPVGSYTMAYAAGTKWYGSKHKFGPGMVSKRFDTTMDFMIQGDSIVGKVVSLTRVRNGNLQSTAINPNELD